MYSLLIGIDFLRGIHHCLRRHNLPLQYASSNSRCTDLLTPCKVSKRSANLNRRIILSAISLLYLLALGDFIIEWYYLNLAVVTNGDTRKSIFISTLEGGSPWIFILDDCFYYGVFLVSDMLLVSKMLPS